MTLNGVVAMNRSATRDTAGVYDDAGRDSTVIAAGQPSKVPGGTRVAVADATAIVPTRASTSVTRARCVMVSTSSDHLVVGREQLYRAFAALSAPRDLSQP